MAQDDVVEWFLNRWRGVDASELATAQSFVIDLCALLGVEQPLPTAERDYMFERPVEFRHGDGTTSAGRIDCYKRGHFVLEAKKVKAGARTKAFDDALLRARAQGEHYARALPAAEGRPPFVVVVDVGRVIELYAEFSRSGATYTPFPDPRSHRIELDDLRQPALRERLRAVWVDPLALDPSRISARVTREVAESLAKVAHGLEQAGHTPQDVAAFLARCLFSMFAEDVDLLPRTAQGETAFEGLLKRYRTDPPTLQRMMAALWADMDRGGFCPALAQDVLRFNGKLFKASGSAYYALPLAQEQIEGLLAAARADWTEVEPAIFGTLLERALSPEERHALGAHYTPRSYVERLVLPTVIEPLRGEWADAQAAALLLANEANTLEGKKRKDKLAEARHELERFHHRLCTVRVLDPACGSGNFLYVTLEHLKRLEGEVLNQMEALGDTQSALAMEGESVTLQQLRGIECNERAAALAELVLWIGYLQWHLRTHGRGSVVEPVVHDYGNIECRDAVLAYDDRVPARGADGNILTCWDAKTYRAHPVTGQPVPDESARTVQWRYVAPRKADWPQADFLVGNPPFIGNKRMRDALGDGYVSALRAAWPEVPESADYVMYWWQKAAETTRTGAARRFGLITTNSLTMIFNRRVIEAQQSASPPLGLAFAIPDHPWVDSADGAAVRIAMTVGAAGCTAGELRIAEQETLAENGEVRVDFQIWQGTIHPDLTVGANVTAVVRLQANDRLSNRGVIPHGAGFVVTPEQALALGLGTVPGLDRHIRPYRNGRDVTGRPRGVLVIDLHGLTVDEVRVRFPEVFQWLWERVKPERDHNPERYRRENWWLFARRNTELRSALSGLLRYIVTPQVAKHRVFQWMDAAILPDDKLIAIASDDALHLGVLSSRVHGEWALAAGGRLGVGNDPVYSKSTCFDPFPFPDTDTGLTPELAQRIRALAEQIDAHRKARQALYEDVTLTGLYNVLDMLRNGTALAPRDQTLHEHGLVSVLRTLHDELDAAVLDAYGWGDLRWPQDADATAALLARLVELNARRAGEEAAGTIRWLRPAFQRAQTAQDQSALALAEQGAQESPGTPVPIEPCAWPTGLPAQIKAVAEVLARSTRPLDQDAIAAHFTARGRWRDRLPTILATLEALGRARMVDAQRWSDTAP
ncbi:class I SAM-dependent DNA methyltransferase [Candidatus Symbiobacter mobilis]|nr:DNA methyltransferase [Candidatus Symbiobacter mobilis]